MNQQKRQLSRFNTVMIRVSMVMAAIAAITLAVMMLVAVIDVGGREFFLAPLEGAFELGGILLVIAGSWGMGYCQLQKGNIRISVLTDLFPPRVQASLYVVAYLICIAATAIICWQGSLRMYDYIFKELGGVTETLSMPFWPFMLMMAIGFGWVCIIFIIDLFNSFVEVFKR